jgi:hypothetical protein
MDSRWRLLLALPALLAAIPLAASRAFPAPIQAQAAAPRGFFRTEKRQGRWWLIDPDGKPFLSKGVASVTYGGDRIRDTTRAPYGETTRAKYGTPEAWKEATAERLVSQRQHRRRPVGRRPRRSTSTGHRLHADPESRREA